MICSCELLVKGCGISYQSQWPLPCWLEWSPGRQLALLHPFPVKVWNCQRWKSIIQGLYLEQNGISGKYNDIQRSSFTTEDSLIQASQLKHSAQGHPISHHLFWPKWPWLPFSFQGTDSWFSLWYSYNPLYRSHLWAASLSQLCFLLNHLALDLSWLSFLSFPIKLWLKTLFLKSPNLLESSLFSPCLLSHIEEEVRSLNPSWEGKDL